MTARLIKHEVVPDCGSYEVRFPDGGSSKNFYLDDLPSHRLRPDLLGSGARRQHGREIHVQEDDADPIYLVRGETR
jgi:hypothetical protein